MAKVLKVKYFYRHSFLKARQDHNPRYIWRSTWNAKTQLVEGLSRRVGDGAPTLAWRDTWVPKEFNIEVLSHTKALIWM